MKELVTETMLEAGYLTWVKDDCKHSTKSDVLMRCSVCGHTSWKTVGKRQVKCGCQSEGSVIMSHGFEQHLADYVTYDCGDLEWYSQHVKCDCGCYNYRSRFILKSDKCSGCRRPLLKVSEPQTNKSKLGQKVGIYTVVGQEKGGYLLACDNGTVKKYKSLLQPSQNKQCNCEKCNPNRGWTSKKYSNTWNKIKDTDCLFWKSYYDFESWIDENLPKPEGKSHLNKIVSEKPYQPDNVWWASSDKEFHFNYWKKFLVELPDGIELIDSSCDFTFRCSKGHVFTRDKGTTADTYRKGEPRKIKCLDCQMEAALTRELNKKYIPTPKETVPKSIPSVILLSDNKTWTDGIGRFECSECYTCFEMPMSVFRSKKVCPICKSEQWGKFCDDRIKERFGGKIVRTGVWTNGDTETTWKCLKHGRHYTNKYDRIINSLTGCCPDCLEFTVPDPDAPTTLYYVRLKYDNTHFYKIGITQRDVELRFEGEIAKRNLHIVKEWVYPTWADAYEVEQKIVKSHQGELLCRGERPLRKTGSTEIFYHDVLELDHAKNH